MYIYILHSEKQIKRAREMFRKQAFIGGSAFEPGYLRFPQVQRGPPCVRVSAVLGTLAVDFKPNQTKKTKAKLCTGRVRQSSLSLSQQS